MSCPGGAGTAVASGMLLIFTVTSRDGSDHRVPKRRVPGLGVGWPAVFKRVRR